MEAEIADLSDEDKQVFLADMGFKEAGVELTDRGFVKVGADYQTNVPGVYAAGDIRQNAGRQAICAAGDGATLRHTLRRRQCAGGLSRFLHNQ